MHRTHDTWAAEIEAGTTAVWRRFRRTYQIELHSAGKCHYEPLADCWVPDIGEYAAHVVESGARRWPESPTALHPVALAFAKDQARWEVWVWNHRPPHNRTTQSVSAAYAKCAR